MKRPMIQINNEPPRDMTSEEIAAMEEAMANMPQPEPTETDRLTRLEGETLKTKKSLAELGNLIGRILRGGGAK